jgi:SAM-dependent methyltransferase
VYQPDVARVGFAEGMQALSDLGYTVVRGGVDMTAPGVMERIGELAALKGLAFRDYPIEAARYRKYVVRAGYPTQYRDYYPGNQVEKSFEHFVCLDLLHVDSSDVFIDIASEHSPLAEISARLTGATTYSQDIMYPDGIVGSRIGGDACSMPVPDGFATKACLTCSLEHFEGDGDTRLFRELARVLRPGGAVCIVPFYVYPEAVTQTDPTISVPAGVRFDPGVPIYCAEGWANRHGRFYSPDSFVTRVALPLRDRFRFEVFSLSNAPAIDAAIYGRLALVATRR